MNKLFTVIFYLSLVFLVAYLYKLNYFVFPEIKSYSYFILSLLCLFAGFLGLALNWKENLKITDIHISTKSALVSTGLSTFMKYIPGKVMVLLGRAMYVTSKTGKNITITSSISFFNQVIALWIGLVLGIIVLINATPNDSLNKIIFVFLSLLSLIIIFQKQVFRVIKFGAGKIKKEVMLPEINTLKVFQIFPYFLMQWGFWGLGFFFLIKSVYIIEPISYKLIFAFPLTTTLGMAAVFAPGGLGIREGLLVGCMTLHNIPIEISTSIAILSRAWFLVGEGFIFLTSIILRKYD